MRKKIGIITWCNNEWKTNYGQVLQAYALQQYLVNEGYDAKNINYRPETEKEKGFLGRFVFRSFLGEEIRKAIVIEKKYSLRILKFYLFVRKYVRITKPCHTKKQVERIAATYNCIISGSDQIWSPYRFQEVRLLGIDSQAKKISYASSGIFEESDEVRPIYEKMAEYWKRYSSIAVREEVAIKIIQKYTDKSVQWVVDPVLLLDNNNWLKLCSKRKRKEKYMLCYFLGEIRSYLHMFPYIQKRFGIEEIIFLEADDVECNCPSFGTVVKGVGPKEFLSLIRDAQIVCTDSYHGTLLALIFEREYYVFARNGMAGKKFSSPERWRVIEEQWGLRSRKVRNTIEIDNAIPIDYSKIKNVMKRDIDNSKKYLINELES